MKLPLNDVQLISDKLESKPTVVISIPSCPRSCSFLRLARRCHYSLLRCPRVEDRLRSVDQSWPCSSAEPAPLVAFTSAAAAAAIAAATAAAGTAGGSTPAVRCAVISFGTRSPSTAAAAATAVTASGGTFSGVEGVNPLAVAGGALHPASVANAKQNWGTALS